MKKTAIIILAIIMAMGLTACSSGGVTQEEYDSVLNELNSLKNENNNSNNISQEEYNKIVDELNSLKNENNDLNKMLRPHISEFPACKAVASEWSKNLNNLFDFMFAWVSGPGYETASTLPQDYLCYDEQAGFLWFVILPNEPEDTKGYELIDIPGGLYVSAIAIDDNNSDLNKTIDYLKNWVDEQDNFELDFSPGRYRMTHVLTSEETTKALGYGQLEVFIPIKIIG